MGLPGVDIEIENGQLGLIIPTADAYCGYVLSGAAATGLALGVAKLITALQEAEDLGITEDYDSTNSVQVHQQIESFYKRAGSGSPLWILLAPATMLYADMVEEARKILDAATTNRIVTLGVNRYPDGAYTPSKTKGLDDDVVTGVTALETLRREYAKRHKPFRAVIGARDIDADLSVPHDFRTGDDRGVLVYAGNDDASINADVAAVLGRRAANPIQRNIGRKKDGDIGYDNAYLTNGNAIEDYTDTTLGLLHDKGYTFPRIWPEYSGYYFCNDLTATLPTDDYSSWARGHVTDKAAVIAYKTFVEEMLDDNDTDDEGKIDPAVIKTYQTTINNQLTETLVNTGNATAARSVIDAGQNVLSTETTKIKLFVRPKFYNRTLLIKLGFENPALTT